MFYFNDALNTFYLWLYGIRNKGMQEMFYLMTHILLTVKWHQKYGKGPFG